MLFNKFSIVILHFHLLLMLVNWVVKPVLLVLSVVFFLLVKVYLASNFFDELTFSSLSLGFAFFHDRWLFASWVCVLPGGHARLL